MKKIHQLQLQTAVKQYSQAEQCELLKIRILNKAKRDLLYFGRKILGYKDLSDTAHRTIVDALQDDCRRKLIVCPRGSFKSTLGVVAYSMWLLLKNPNLRILIDSELFSNSSTFLREIKMLYESERVTEIIGLSKGSVWNEGEIIIKQRTQSYKEASITCSGVGAVKVGQHYDVIISDDLNSNKNSGTPEARQKVIDHYRYSQSILEPHGMMVIIGTRYSAGDLIGFILEQELNLSGDGKDCPQHGRIRISTKDSLQP